MIPHTKSHPPSNGHNRTSGSWALFCDIDGTLIGETETSKRLRQVVLAERARLAAKGERLWWVISTGRRLDSALEVLQDQGFESEDFDAFITAVGATVHLGAHEEPFAPYNRWLGSDGFDRTKVEALVCALPGFTPQPREEQHPHKVSYFADDTIANRDELKRLLAQLPFPCQAVWSHDFYVDIAPARGAKGGAIEFLTSHLRLPRGRTAAAGDSGNDLSMLERDLQAIVVGNGHNSLGSLRGRNNVYFADRKYAAGVLEGLVHFGFLPVAGR